MFSVQPPVFSRRVLGGAIAVTGRIADIDLERRRIELRPVIVRHKDRDLLTFKDEILGKQGEQAWAAFLRTELAKRKQVAHP